MSRIFACFLILFLLGTSGACAERSDTEDQEAQARSSAPQPTAPDPSAPETGAPASDEGGIWKQTLERASRWWSQSQERAEGVWQGTRRYLTQDSRDQFARVWGEILPTLEETLALEERQERLPETSWFGDDRVSNRAAIDRLLDQAVAILSTSDVQQYRAQIRRLQQRIAEARRDISEYRRLRIAAPRESLIEKTAADYERAIASREKDIAQYEQRMEEVKEAFTAELRAMGLAIREDQVNLLLSTVVGDNLIDLGVVFANVRAITEQLEDLAEKSGEDLQTARRYYGMYVILLKSLYQMHRQVEQAIAGKYLPQIDAIVERTRALSEQTRALRRQAPEKRAILDANLRAQQLTLEAAALYRRYLREQGRQVTAARIALETDIATAWNTYETVRISGEFVSLVKASRNLLDGLLKRQIPSLRPFENLEMQREFEKLTAQLRAEGT